MIRIIVTIFMTITTCSMSVASNLSIVDTTIIVHPINFADSGYRQVSPQKNNASARRAAPPLMRIDQKGQLSAKFENVSLGEIKSFFEQNYQIEFLGDEVLFQAHRSIVFNNLSLEAAIKRLFSKTNFVLNYDSEGTVIEVRLLPTGDGKNFSAVTDTVVENRQLPVQQPNVAVDSGDEITSFQIEEGSPPPGDFPGDEINPASLDSSFQVDAVSPALDPSFQVIPNSPPSGKDFQIVPGLPPSRK